MIGKLFLLGMLLCLFANSVSAQLQTPEKELSNLELKEQICEPPFYAYKELSQKAKITRRPSFGRVTEEYRKGHLKHGLARISAVLCKNGKVTDIQVIKGLPFGMTERLIDAIRKVEFIPAEKNGKPVSQIQIFEFSITLF